MIWWLRTSRIAVIVTVSVGIGSLTVIASDLKLFIPVLTGGLPFRDLPLKAILPLVIIVVAGSIISTATPTALSASVRNLHAYNVIYLLLTAAIASTSAAIASLPLERGFDWMIIRNLFGFAALFLLGSIFTGYRFASLVPVVYVFLVAMFGHTPSGGASPWAWPLFTCTWTEAAFFVVLSLLSGWLILSRRTRPGAQASRG